MIEIPQLLFLVGVLFLAGIVCLFLLAVVMYGSLWLQAYFSSVEVSALDLVRMSLRRVDPSLVVSAKVMSRQAGIEVDTDAGISTFRLEAHVLAGGDLMRVLQAIVAAKRAGIDLNFEKAAAIDLAGRNVREAVRTSVSPTVIDCPTGENSGKKSISAIAKDGVELKIHARVTVRTNLAKLIGGATEETVVARVGQGIISAIGSANSHMDVMEKPDLISRQVLSSGLDANTSFEIVSIDIADISVGDNIGARLQSDQAAADTRMAQAAAEARRAEAIARIQEMKAEVTRNRATFLMAEAEIPPALAMAFRSGQLRLASSQTHKLPLAQLDLPGSSKRI